MSKRGRKPLAVPRVARRIYIRADLSAEVDLVLLDPMRDKVKYGALSDLVEKLLEEWLNNQRREQTAQFSQLCRKHGGDGTGEHCSLCHLPG